MGGAKEPDANSGGLMDVSGMAEMQAAIAAELNSKYEEKIRTLQAKIVQAEKKRKQEEHARRQQNTDDIKKAMEAAAKAAETKLKRKEEQIAKKNERLKEMKKRQQDMAKKAATATKVKAVVEKKEEEEKLEGWLQKKGAKGPVKKWRWRWFAYEPQQHRLCYYTKVGPKIDLKGFIELRDCQSVYVLPNEFQVRFRVFLFCPFLTFCFLLVGNHTS